MKKKDKLWKGFWKEKEDKEEKKNKKLGRKRIVSMKALHNFFGSESGLFHKELLIWAYRQGWKECIEYRFKRGVEGE